MHIKVREKPKTSKRKLAQFTAEAVETAKAIWQSRAMPPMPHASGTCRDSSGITFPEPAAKPAGYEPWTYNCRQPNQGVQTNVLPEQPSSSKRRANPLARSVEAKHTARRPLQRSKLASPPRPPFDQPKEGQVSYPESKQESR